MARPHDPVPREARTELERLVLRWQQLPRDRALARVDSVRRLAQRIGDDVARAQGRSPAPLPDLGPATSMDQLLVVAYDAAAQGLPPVTDDLAALRRDLATA